MNGHISHRLHIHIAETPMNTISHIKRDIEELELIYTPVKNIGQLDDTLRDLLSTIGYVVTPSGHVLLGYGNVNPKYDLYMLYLKYKEELQFFPRDSVPVLKIDGRYTIVYDLSSRRAMIVDVKDNGVIHYSFDGGLLEIVRGYIK